ncbi:nuclear transport factor 2 family protein [Desertimonas flava]|uniref:nuclear transport factor 2 family protein n=1 Tax=Desertimonas flava TaxID=2064846 RepID=UPI000E34C95D|nr:nuclear transport factor 2 family protein [Desertimonas flava]
MSACLRCTVEAHHAAFAWSLDHGDVAGLMTLFGDDAEYDNGRVVLRGAAELSAWFTARATAVRTTRHVWSSLRLGDHLGDGVVTATSVWTCYAANGPAPHCTVGVSLVADFDDRFEIGPTGGLLLQRRRISGVFSDPALAPPAVPT